MFHSKKTISYLGETLAFKVLDSPLFNYPMLCSNKGMRKCWSICRSSIDQNDRMGFSLVFISVLQAFQNDVGVLSKTQKPEKLQFKKPVNTSKHSYVQATDARS